MEQPLLGGGAQESFDSGEFRRFIKGLEYVEESDSNTSSEIRNTNSLELKSGDKSVVPRFKVEAGFIICIGTFLIKLAWPLHNTLNLLFSIIVFALLIYKTEMFFGFALSGCCPIRFKEIEAGPKEAMVSYSRWAMVPLTILVEIIYFSLESRLHEPAKIVFASLLTLQLLYILGAFDYCADCMNPKPVNTNRYTLTSNMDDSEYASIANMTPLERPFIN